MINFHDYVNENNGITFKTVQELRSYNSNWPYIIDNLYRILIIDGSASGKTNSLVNLINNQPDIDKIHLHAKDPHQAKCQFLINKRESIGLKHFNDSQAFLEYSNDMQDFYKNIEYNTDKERKILIVFDDMIAAMINNQKLNSIVIELFIRGRKLNIFLVFITKSYFKFPQDFRLNSTRFFILKIPNKIDFNKLH